MNPGDYFFVTSRKDRRRLAVIIDAELVDQICIAVFNTLDVNLVESNGLLPDFVVLTSTAFFEPLRSEDRARWVVSGSVDIDFKQYYPVFSVRNGGTYVLNTVPSVDSNSVPESVAIRFYNRFSITPAAVGLMIDQLEDGDLHPKLAAALYSPERMGYKALALFDQYS